MDRWKSRGGKSQRREEQKKEDQRRERVRRKKMQVREKVAKSRNSTVFFPMVCGSKSRLAKAAGAEPLLEVEMSKKCTPLWREEDSKSKVQKLAGTGHFWAFRCRLV